jgi:radical SAM superfamily enzyme YgiQ (UPF0313 family)
MKLLLLEHPRGRSARHFNTIANTPLASSLLSGYIASHLQSHGIEAELHDSVSATDDFSATVAAVAGSHYDMLGVHLIYSWEHTPAVLAMLAAVAAQRDVPMIAYGFYPTFAGEYLMAAHRCIDGIIRGEPEMTFLDLCASGDPGRVRGLIWRKGEECAVNPPRATISDLDSLPFPRRTRTGLARCGGTILGSRGCYGNCTFCHINAFYGGNPSWRGRSPAHIHAEVKVLLPLLSAKYLYFVDANFFGPGEAGQKRAEAIAESLEDEAGLSFGLECRANDVRERSLTRLVRAGLRDVFLGIESASPCCLDRINKRTTVQQNREAVALLRRHGIEPHLGFIMFEPDSTMEDVQANFSFLQSNNLLGRLTASVDLLYHQGVALMGTRLYARLREQGRLQVLPEGPYHGGYRFRDEKVQICAGIFSAICGHLLQLMDSPASPLYWQQLYAREDGRPASGAAAEINRWLVSRFEEVLQRLEGDGSLSDRARQDRFIEESLSYVDQVLSGVTRAATESTAQIHD